MGKTIRLSDEFHGWIKAHNEDDETMEETLRLVERGEMQWLPTPVVAECLLQRLTQEF
jgi:hypothetical protein